MSTLQENLDRIKNAKSAIKDAIIQKGIDVTDTEKIETYADKILQIKSGGGTTEIPEFDPDGPVTFYRLDDIGDSYVSLGPNELPDIEYSTDKTTWKTYTSKQKIKLGKGEYVQFKYKSGSATTDKNRFYIDGGLYNLYGLVKPLGKINKTKYYQYMFSNLPIIDASNLTLGDTNNIAGITGNCAYMFQNCILLTGLPKITTKILSDSCYMFMFQNCVSLKSIPNNYLPTPNEVKNNMYESMFSGCTGLTTLPSNLITFDAYRDQGQYLCKGMFEGCTGLTTLPSNLLPATRLTSYCYESMFSGCTGLTTIPSNLLPATTLADNCYQYMFYNCTSLTTVPSNLLPATTLIYKCYSNMFQGCTSLTTIPDLPATTLAVLCYEYMFCGCIRLTTLPSGLLPATTLANNCYQYMFYGCTSLTTIPKLPATTLADYCYQYMFYNCTSLVETPDGWYLPNVTTLPSKCYSYMFQYCSKLQKMAVAYSSGKALDSTSWGSPWYYWMGGVSSTGTFYYSKNQTKENIKSIVPKGWTLVQSTAW